MRKQYGNGNARRRVFDTVCTYEMGMNILLAHTMDHVRPRRTPPAAPHGVLERWRSRAVCDHGSGRAQRMGTCEKDCTR